MLCQLFLFFRGNQFNRHRAYHALVVFFSVSTALFNEFFQQLFENPHHGVLLLDATKSILASNTYFLNHTGYSARQLLNKPIHDLDSDKHSDDFHHRIWQDVESKGYWSGVVFNHSARW
ncbi:PAS domain-containing protein [Vibrio sinaloensis]|nr:PAS domain-containing protein [Vibrio sinaloensis]